MIEREFIKQNLKEHSVEEFVSRSLKRVGHSHTKMIRTPLGEKIVIFTSRPGLIVGRKGENIKKLTKALKKEFNLKNPQIEISEVEQYYLDAQIVAERIADGMERFDSSKFKAIGHKMMAEIMNAGAIGVEILISGKVPSARARVWRFYQGYLKKCGDVSIEGVKQAYTQAHLRSGTVGIQVRIMPPDVRLPDRISLITEKVEEPVVQEVKEEKKKARSKK
ncbi:30S ribosomal protein S3 [Candidatus Woesearchaeota archaeon]|nr:30S ribosomal protein S3P, small subunit ribosomal protein S3 [uncultured archaeon]KHO47193.1 MAG: 30S ribosomal protein S3P, small subunit ribosomal protein S3 [archaeon GW2011_AR4]MBS3129186.1 30S ribosomal protein S3 [Candidatus Woesearchaeota archaeon]HIH37919.1 30S ribosomal protein S3 [Candidatus Woesearchaeota archaeon]HIH48872.1 30S ribosomal protein S3 [Candidatus Woesearchaeota archaeon]